MFDGSIVALVTPMRDDGALDFSSLRALISWHLASGTDAIVIGGTTGEGPVLADDELVDLVGFAVECVEGRVPVIAGCGTNSTDTSCRRARKVAAAGADACLAVTPYYNKPTQAGLVRHYQALGDAAAVPLILYNVPSRTACDLAPASVATLAAHENIVAIKEAAGGAGRVKEILERCDLIVLSGDDFTCLAAMRAGAKGVVSVANNVAPRQMAAMCQLAAAGRYDEAAKIDAELRPLYDALFVESSPIPVKWAMNELGLIKSGIRLPLTPLSPAHHDTVREALARIDLTATQPMTV